MEHPDLWDRLGERTRQTNRITGGTGARVHLPIDGSVWRAHGHPARGRAPGNRGKTRHSPEASSFAKATEDETAGRSPMPFAPPSMGRCGA